MDAIVSLPHVKKQKPVFSNAFAVGFLLLLVLLVTPARADIEGQPKVLGGATLRIGGEVIHLFGIDAPDHGQICDRLDAAGQRMPYDCGFEAANTLGFMTAYQWVKCREVSKASNGEIIAKCVLGGRYDIGGKMVRQGWALPSGAGVPVYADAAAHAQKERAGMWAGDFKTPWDWRAARR